MKQFYSTCGLMIWCFSVGSEAGAAEARLRVQTEGTNTLIQVESTKQNEWRFQTSPDLSQWQDAPGLGTLFSGGPLAPTRAIDRRTEAMKFLRALKTEGLYDTSVLRTISLTFTQANWATLLTTGRNTGSNTLANLVMDNGVEVAGVGVRYRGNTSFTGMGAGGAPAKKSVNIDINYTNDASELMGFKTVNLNNSYGDQTIMHEALYFSVMRQYAVCPHGSLIKLNINGAYWGVYSFAQQENGDLVKEWCPSSDGDRWRAPNMPAGGGGGGGGGPASGTSALSYLGASEATYKSNYELKAGNATNAWQRLIHATYVLNNTPAAQLRDKVEEVLAVDRWLWFLALENIFADDDSYWNKGADYEFYHEPESGRIHPIEHDGNESFFAGDTSLSPVQGATLTTRPVLYKLLGVPELRQRYLAHMRTVLQESYNPTKMTALINKFAALSAEAIAADTKKGFTMATWTNALTAMKSFVTTRYNFLTNHAELRPLAPEIVAVNAPGIAPTPAESPFITAEVQPNGNNGLDSVWLYYREKSYGLFQRVQMFDDGAHGDGAAADHIFGAATTNFPAGTKVRFYVEARSANAAKAASFSPARAEEDTYNYRVGLLLATNSPVVINEFLASNQKTVADPQGEYDDWIEIHNRSSQEVDLSGCYLTDDPTKPRKWQFPAGTQLAAGGYLVVWADEDGSATSGLHASFKLTATGEQIMLIDSDANLNAVLDAITYGAQYTDYSYGRRAGQPETWEVMVPTPGQPNH